MRLDIVIPAHNEERRIDATLRAYRAHCSGPDTQFIVALDSCTDGTAEIVGRHAREDGRVRSFEYPKLGKGGVVKEAFARSEADLVAFVDADGATPPGELMRLAAAARHADGAIASRRHPAALLPVRRPLPRRVASAGFAFGVRRLLGLPYTDTQCGAKVLKLRVAREVLPAVSTSNLCFDVDLLLAARSRGHRILEVPTIWIDHEDSSVRLAADTRRMGLSLLRLWLRERRRGAAPERQSPRVRLRGLRRGYA